MQSRFALLGAVVLTAALGGCSTSKIIPDVTETGWFREPVNDFAKPDWARPTVDAKGVQLGPNGPVAPDDLVSADGACAAPAAQPVATTGTSTPGEPAPAAQANASGFDGGLQPGLAPIVGGIALGMTECETVRRAGAPTNVAIGAGDKGERKVVLTYLSGHWPGIYTFNSGRLKVIERAPEPPKQARPAPKKKTAKPKT